MYNQILTTIKHPIIFLNRICLFIQGNSIHYLKVKGPLYSRLYNMGKKNNEGKPAPPKKPLSAFFLFRGEVYDDVKSKNPTAKITELTKIISEMWGTVDEATKTRLEAEYKTNKGKYEEDKAAYEKQHGKIERKSKKVAKKEK